MEKENSMAGPYVHCLVSRKALKLFNNPSFGGYSGVRADGVLPYLYLGSVSPDYPYPACMIANVNPAPDKAADGSSLWWGDKLHKQNTGDFVKSGLASLRKLMKDGAPDNQILLAWLLGYYSHIITDTVVHAVVYNIVGRYEQHSTEHRKCEMVEDPLLFMREENKELVGDNFLSILEGCQTLEPFSIDKPMEPRHYILNKAVRDLWDGILHEVYPAYHAVEKPEIDAWHREYLKVNYFATGSLGRAVGGAGIEAISYQKTDEIDEKDRAKYYSEMKIPGRATPGEYKADVFDYAVSQVMKGWGGFLKALTDDAEYDNFGKSLANIDLDTGTADGVNYALWPGGKTSDWKA